MKKLYFLFIIALLFSSSPTFGQKPGGSSKSHQQKISGSNMEVEEYFIPLPPLLVDDDSLVSVTLYGYSYIDDEIRIYDTYWSAEPIIIKKTQANEFYQIELPTEKIVNCLIKYSDSSSNPPSVGEIKNNCLFLNFDYVENIHVRIKTKYSNYYSNIYNPTYALSKNYKITTYKNPNLKNNSNSFPFVNIVGIYDKTRVSFYVGGDSNTLIKYRDGKFYKTDDIIKDTLNRGDYITVTGYDENTDLTCSMVMANKPVSISTGNTYSSLKGNETDYGLLYGNDLPVIAWDTKFYIPPLKNNGKKPILRITARDSANVYAGDSLIGKIKYQYGMKDSSWIEYEVEENKPITIWGDGNINVVSYSTGIMENPVNSPLQTAITPIILYNYSSSLYVPDLGIENQKDFASFIIVSDTNGNIPEDFSFVIYSEGVKEIKKSIKDFNILNLQEVYDPELTNQKKKVLSFSIELEKGKYYSIYSREKFRIYANGYNDEFNYLFSNSSQTMVFEIPDTLCPEPHYRLNGSGICYRAETYVVDRPRDDDQVRTNMALIQFDKTNSYNFIYHCDDFIPGETDSVNWWVDVVDMHQDARAVIMFVDRAGNDTTIVVEYKARKMDFDQSTFDFGYVKPIQSRTQLFNITNNATEDFNFCALEFGAYTNLHRRNGFELNFLFDTTKSIAPNETVQFEVTFHPITKGTFRDSIYLRDPYCYKDLKLIVTGNSDGSGVNESEIDAIISPNPATEYITLNIPPLEKRGSGGVLRPIQIYDVFGNCALNVGAIHELPLRIDISALSAGVYFVRIGDKVEKFVKM